LEEKDRRGLEEAASWSRMEVTVGGIERLEAHGWQREDSMPVVSSFRGDSSGEAGEM